MDRPRPKTGSPGLAPDDLTFDQFLEHHGVKGMHWGVRKAGETTETGEAPKPVKRVASSADSKTADRAQEKIDAHGTRVLSNEELQKLVTRMNLEQQYDRLNSDPSVAQGKNAVDQILGHANRIQLVYKHLNSPLAKSTFKIAKKGFKIAKRVAENPGAQAAAGVGLALL